MNVLFRVDSSIIIGTGHLIRCLTLADMLKKSDAKITFICRDLPNNLSKLVVDRGFELILLPYSESAKNNYIENSDADDYATWLGVSQQQDIEDCQNIFKKNNSDLLVIDHYGIDISWETIARDYTKKIMVIDDLANRQHDCDIILDHNYYANLENRYNKLIPKDCQKLLGPTHALLSAKLKEVKFKRQELGKSLNPKEIKNVLVFLGGIDPDNYTDKALEKALKSQKLKKSIFNVVLGENNTNKVVLKQKYAEHDNIIFHVQPEYYFDLMVDADLAIGAAGVSLLERCYIKLPSIIFNIAHNQNEIAEHAISQCIAIDVNVLNLGLFNDNLKDLDVETLNLSEVVCA